MKRTIMVIMLMLTALAVQTSFCMDAIDRVEKNAKALLSDLKEYKKCRKSDKGCPEDLTARLGQRAKYIAIGAAGVVATAAAATGLAVLGYKLRRRMQEPGEEESTSSEEEAEESTGGETGEIVARRGATPPPLPPRDIPQQRRQIESKPEQLYRDHIRGTNLSEPAKKLVWAASLQEMDYFRNQTPEAIVRQLRNEQELRQVLLIVRRIAGIHKNHELQGIMDAVQTAFSQGGAKPGQN